MASGENVLWTVEKHGQRGTMAYSGKVYATFVFRTRKAALEFAEAKNRKSKRYWYTSPKRATWGPEQ